MRNVTRGLIALTAMLWAAPDVEAQQAVRPVLERGHHPVALTAPQPLAIMQDAPRGELRSERAAVLWSAIPTFGPLILARVADPDGHSDAMLAAAGAGVFVGPALGHFYAGKAGRGLLGIGIRVALAGATWSLMRRECSDSCTWDDFANLFPNLLILGLGAGAILGDATFDVAMARVSARSHNEEIQRRRSDGVKP